MRVLVGTSGYSYKEWKGSFYPSDLPSTQMLRYYAERLRAVEINNTFYRLPRASMLESWAAQVPEGFRFALKASRRITHVKRLHEAGDETDYLLRAAERLGRRLGCILFQLPPHFTKDLARLERFLERLPPEAPRVAFEFRHPSWLDDAVFERLRDRDAALCFADTEDATPELVATATWGYLRLRRADYSAVDLAAWAEAVAAQDWERAYVFFKHEDEGIGPRLAAAFLEKVP